MGLVVAGFLLFELVLEPAPLVQRIVQLAEGVSHFLAADEELEPAGVVRVFRVPLGEGGDLRGMPGDEGRLDQLLFHKGLEHEVEDGEPALGPLDLHAPVFSYPPGLVVVGNVPEIDARVFRHEVEHAPPLEGFVEVEVHVLKTQLPGVAGPADHVGCVPDDLLGEVHHVVVVRVGPVHLHGGELRVVHGVEPLVAEVLSHLIYPAEHAHHEALQVEFRGDAEVHLHAQGVVEGLEGPRVGASRKDRQDRGLHFDGAVVLQGFPDGGDDLRPLPEGLPHLGVGDEVGVPLAVPDFRVLQAVPLLGQGAEGLAEQHALTDMDGEFPPLGPEGMAHDADPVARVDPFFREGVLLLAHGVELEVKLQVVRLVGQVGEGGLPVLAEGHHPSRGDDGHRLVKLVLGQVAEVLPHVGEGVLPVPLFHQVGVVSLLGDQPLELVLPLADDFVLSVVPLGETVRGVLFILCIHCIFLSFQNTRRFVQ
ncbi:hypothetical protein SDC9_55529 [bioreactor metagenome]|uniref:Uncharacterized protein n=1 Tax=bioreactor metagenome TaxID=1076179 RepID=A0A644X4I0_9ZZZZ